MTAAILLDTLAKRSLTRGEAVEAFSRLVQGGWPDLVIAGLLGAFKARGETPEEIAGAADALRCAALPFPRPAYPVADTCGTGGDGAWTLNVSTATAIVAAEMGIPVAKHGNRSISSRCGSADVLEAAGVRLDPPASVSRRCLDETGFCFLFAPRYHDGIRHAMPVRRAFATRTIFNLLGPLANPCRPAFQIVGVYAPEHCRPLARTLSMLEVEAALVIHGGGIDEIALHGPTIAALWKADRLTEIEITPEIAGMRRRPLDALRGGEPASNAAELRLLLEGRGREAYAEAVSINAGALAWISGKCPTLEAGAALARDAVAGGGAIRRLDRCVEISHAS